ncbi:MAG: type II secretion system protein [Phycisphaerales bacterium]
MLNGLLRRSANRFVAAAERRSGFTLIELLVVIAIVVLLIGILLPVLGRMRGAARTTTCLSNHRMIASAMTQYSTENAGRLASPRTDKTSISGPNGTVQVNHVWVNASGANLQTLPDGTKVETQKALEGGVLWPYLDRNPASYKSPLDPTNRLRSYSLNSYIGSSVCPDDYGCGTLVPLPSGQSALPTTTLSTIPSPSSTFCSINEESPLGYNEEGFVVDWSVPFWEDVPAFWDGNRLNVSFVDGSTRALTIFSPRFIDEATASPTGFTESGDMSPGSATGPATWLAFRQYLLPGRLDF